MKTKTAKKTARKAPVPAVKKARRETVKLPKTKTYWKQNDNGSVAAEHGIHRNTAARFRFAHNLPQPDKYSHRTFRQPGVDYKLIDLGLTAAANAEKTGLKESWVAQLMTRLRKQQGLPPGKKGVRKVSPVDTMNKVLGKTARSGTTKQAKGKTVGGDSWFD